ncbi:hypothetical protein Q5P01_010778 [Channa striata]|uniref:Uncharacterized protein n=1 Tax=Channa striata TaxID=64152 RepID=A0AA88MTF9_CHASR|nr:hypothetical protein Q5P01_010778 [Channa striata]
MCLSGAALSASSSTKPFMFYVPMIQLSLATDGSVASVSQHVNPALRQNPALRCDHEVDQEKPPCLKHRRGSWSPVPPPWPTLPHPPPYPLSYPHPTPGLCCSCAGQAT